ncbi:MAG: SDR family NAD(P)-dependent oxidoreductase [Pseudoflavonifractor sp.]|nr:SDR family NAD(P)-dependent oxidoreductase [Pseudoflavonifractor sp.]
MEKKIIIVVGAGKGLGNHIAKKFGKEGFRVVLMARNEESLKEYKSELEGEGIETYIHTADAAKPGTLTEAINWVRSTLGTPDVLAYNVGITAPDDAAKLDSEVLMSHYQVDVASAYQCVKDVVDDEFAKKNGAILLTGGGLAHYPVTGFMPLSLDKAALRTMTYLLHDELKPKGIFVGTVTVCGTIGIDNFFAPARIADNFWKLYSDRDEVEILHEYPQLKDSNLSAGEYWGKVYALKDSVK